jgi:iron complex outermembrane receptor protein
VRASRQAILVGVLSALVSAPVLAAPSEVALDLPPQSLSVTLNQVARTGAFEVVFDRTVTDAKRSPRLKGRFSTARALDVVLAGSGLAWRRNADGAFVVVKPTAAPRPAPSASGDPGDGAVSELLVLGRRNLNTGIRRSRDDIQPYDIADSDTLVRSGGETIEGFMRARMPANAQVATNLQAPVANMAATRSGLDLLGLGAAQTLVLVDGRRLPSLPAPVDPLSGAVWAGFTQADLNGLPLAAIERIEVLTSTAGALYGPGATGGAVNVVLKRDYQGAEASFTQGLSARGDAPAWRFDGHIGHSSPDGRSGLSLTIGLSSFDGLRFEDRDYVLAGRIRRQASASSFADPPVGNDINIVNPFRDGSRATGLTLDPQYGGHSLGASTTHFSINGFSASEAIANAGTLDLSLSPDGFGRKQSLLTANRSASLVLSGRRQWGAIEAFFDVLQLESWGRAVGPSGDPTFLGIFGDAPDNPFQEYILVSVPLPWQGVIRSHDVTRRLNLGLVAQLPRGWTASFDASYSTAMGRTSDERPQQDIGGQIVGMSGIDNPLYPQVSPLEDRSSFLKAYGHYLFPSGRTYKIQDRLQDFNIRAAGPLWILPGGPLTMMLSAQARLERAPLGTQYGWSWWSVDFEKANTPGLGQTTGSVYAEWRAPLVSRQAQGPWRGLEIQLAMRADQVRVRVPLYTDILAEALGKTLFKGQDTVAATTLGIRSFLARDLMIRASYADGYLPTTTQQLNTNAGMSFGELQRVTDAKRGGQNIGSDYGFYVLFGGSPRLSAEKARTVSIGLVYTPGFLADARFSIDYLRTDKSREPSAYLRRNVDYFVAREDQYPDRIIRAPLTDADRALGYTGGVITSVDTTDLSVGRSVVESVDVSADYRRDLGSESALRSYLRMTWQPSYRRRGNPAGPWYETAGHSDGPLKLRGNVGLEWSRDETLVGLNIQYYAGRDVERSGFGWTSGTDEIAIQQATTLPAQTYVDVVMRRAFGSDGQAQLQLVVRNLFDAKAPLDANNELGYSTYGDPRGRRFELTLSRRF